MTPTRIALAFLLTDFLALTGWVLYRHGLVGWVPDLLSSPVGILVAVDLCIALAFVVTWMVRDARAVGRNPWPYLALTAATGSAGPLLYLLLRPAAPPQATAR
jgi:Terpene cyclase DEP1